MAGSKLRLSFRLENNEYGQKMEKQTILFPSLQGPSNSYPYAGALSMLMLSMILT
jgi:hypothetical protein